MRLQLVSHQTPRQHHLPRQAVITIALMIGFILSMFLVGLMLLGSGVAYGQAFPNKPIRIVTTAPGGGNDFIARIIAQGISGPLGQPVIVENRGPLTIGELVAKAPPDGYTLLLSGPSLWVDSLTNKKSYDPIRDFSPITLAVGLAHILVVHPSVPVKTVKELIALAKARPGELNYAAGVRGEITHIIAEMFTSMAGINIVYVPYVASNAAIINVMSGEVQLTFSSGLTVAPHMKSGKLRALAVTSAKRSQVYPDLLTMAETLPGFEYNTVYGLLAPAKTPDAIISRLNQEMVRVLNQTDVKQRFLDIGVDVVGSSPEEFAARIKADVVKINKILIRAN